MARRLVRTTLQDRTQPQKENKDLSFDESVDIFLSEVTIKGQSPQTKRWHSENLAAAKKCLVQEGKDTKPANITETILKKHMIMPLINRGLKVNTINGRIRSTRALFNFLYQEGYISSNPARRIVNLKNEKPIIQTFTKSQIKKLLSVIDKVTFVGFRDYVMILLFLETGMRVSEVVNLRINDIMFEEGLIRILKGKGSKGRLVPFQDRLKKLLQKYLKERGEVGHSYLFITRDEEQLKKKSIQDRIKMYGKKADITDVRCSPHTLRHTMAKFYIISGGDIFSLQKILGHSSLDMVRNYVELFGNEVKEQHKKFSPLKDFDVTDE